MVDLSIVIVNWNTRALLADCLDSVYAQAEGLVLEVFVVDNASADGSPAMVRERFPQVRLVANTANVGFAPANNQAIRQAVGRHVLLLNSDTVVHAGALRQMVAFLDAHPRCGVAGACLLNGDGSLQASWAQFPSLWSEVLGRNLRVRQPLPGAAGQPAFAVDWVGGACLMIRRAAIDQVGLMDERFFMYSEETDWCYRVKQAGWAIAYLPEARVTHFGGASSRQNNVKMFVELNRSKLYFFRKHYGPVRAGLLRLSLLGATVAKMAWLWAASRLNPAQRPNLARQQALFTALQAPLQ